MFISVHLIIMIVQQSMNCCSSELMKETPKAEGNRLQMSWVTKLFA